MIRTALRSLAIGCVLSLPACTGEPVAKQVGPGSTVAVALSQLSPDVTVGFGSALAGADPQRGQLSFVLCNLATPDCDPSPTLTPRQGYRMTTTYVTRTQADGTALSAGARIVGAAFEVPSSGSNRPVPGTYWLEPRIQAPNGAELLAVLDGAVGTLEVLPDDGVPTSLTNDDPTMLTALQDRVPRPALRIQQDIASGATPAAAADLEIDFPSNKVRIVGVTRERSASLVELVSVDSDTVRVIFARRGDAPAPSGPLEDAFALTFELIGSAPVQASEFAIASQTTYDSNASSSSTLFMIDRIF